LKRRVVFNDEIDSETETGSQDVNESQQEEDKEEATAARAGEEAEYNATEKVLQDVKDTWGNQRTQVCSKLLFLCLTQVLLICFLFVEVMHDQTVFHQKNPSMMIVLTRFLCAAFLHVQLADEIKQGFDLMKFANNHHWLFRHWGTAFVIGFL